MDESELLFNLVYLLLCMCIIYPPEEFQHIGLTIEHIFSRCLGDETLDFVNYHQRRTSLNLFVHSCLPIVYFLIHSWRFSESQDDLYYNFDPDFPMPQEAVAFKTLTWKIAQRFSLLGVLVVPVLIFNWYHQDWRRHPISQTLTKFANSTQNYREVANDIGTEFRRFGNYKKKLNSISTLVATENWIIKTTLYGVKFAYQSDTALTVAKAETYNISVETNDTLQMISIIVEPHRQGVSNFHIRINSIDFRHLEERVRRPISIPSNIQFHRSVIDRFVDAFKTQVALNPIYICEVVMDKCFACMLVEPNIKINKQCLDTDRDGHPLPDDGCCSNCYCRPMWCAECLARWFATRQSELNRDIWLEQKCTCPMCRAKFCVRDVSYVRQSADPDGDTANTNASEES